MAAPRAASRLSPVNSTSTPTWGGRSEARRCMYDATWPSNTATRDSCSFSPMTAAAASMFSATVWPSASRSASSVGTSEIRVAATWATMSAASCWNCSALATKSVSQLSSIMTPSAAATRPLDAVRSWPRLIALAAPLIRRISVAFSKSPSASSRARFVSIIPAPVASRSFLTSATVKFAIVVRSVLAGWGVLCWNWSLPAPVLAGTGPCWHRSLLAPVLAGTGPCWHRFLLVRVLLVRVLLLQVLLAPITAGTGLAATGRCWSCGCRSRSAVPRCCRRCLSGASLLRRRPALRRGSGRSRYARRCAGVPRPAALFGGGFRRLAGRVEAGILRVLWGGEPHLGNGGLVVPAVRPVVELRVGVALDREALGLAAVGQRRVATGAVRRLGGLGRGPGRRVAADQ